MSSVAPTLTPVCPVRLKKGHEAEIRKGMPWIYSGDIIDSSEPLLAPPGSLVAIENHKGQTIGVGYFNAKSQIACRVLTLTSERINSDFFKARLSKALSLRERLVSVPYYRLVHSESDNLPGLLVDRFGDIIVVQSGTAGMDHLQSLWLQAVDEVIKPHAILLRNDIAARALEGIKQHVMVVKASVPTLIEVRENNCFYYADLMQGQKTGWFYDQRDNRSMIANLAKGKTLLDIYAHSGGFGLLAAKQGAAHVTLADSSRLALDLAQQAAQRNQIANRCDQIQGDAFTLMEQWQQKGMTFDIVLADPPAFIKSKKDIISGLKGYEKVARLASYLVKPNGWLFVASCSHHALRPQFNRAVQNGVIKAGRKAVIHKQTGAAPDHPRHPYLAQSEYLKGILLQLTD